jgi:Pyruvate/2-oxoacid:ferredoxin oxidoreductase delta subunit
MQDIELVPASAYRALILPHTPSDKNQYQCHQCGLWWPEIFFRQNRRKNKRCHIYVTRPRCKGCEISKRTDAKKVDPFIAKASSTIGDHARKYNLSREQFVWKYGWHLHRVAHLLRHAFENTCTYCRRAYKEIGGLNDLTIDIRDPAQEPFLDTNAVPCCRTCNSEKGDMTSEQWGTVLMCWRKWEEWHSRQPEFRIMQQTDLFVSDAKSVSLTQNESLPIIFEQLQLF